MVRRSGGANLDEEALRAHVRKGLAGYKTPKRVVSTDQSIRASNGKADYATARKIAETTLP